MLRRSVSSDCSLRRLALMIGNFYGAFRYEKVHPLQSGILRRKNRRTRRPTLPRENPLVFYPRRVRDYLTTYLPLAWGFVKLRRLTRKIDKDPTKWGYTDQALAKVEVGAEEELEMFERSDQARENVARARVRVARAAAKKSASS